MKTTPLEFFTTPVCLYTTSLPHCRYISWSVSVTAIGRFLPKSTFIPRFRIAVDKRKHHLNLVTFRACTNREDPSREFLAHMGKLLTIGYHTGISWYLGKSQLPMVSVMNIEIGSFQKKVIVLQPISCQNAYMYISLSRATSFELSDQTFVAHRHRKYSWLFCWIYLFIWMMFTPCSWIFPKSDSGQHFGGIKPGNGLIGLKTLQQFTVLGKVKENKVKKKSSLFFLWRVFFL